jgi:hypothetical protein
MADETIPCIPIPEAQTVKIPLPFGAELRSIVDISKPPSDCTLAHSLMLQISPALGSMACLFKLLKVAKELMDILPTKASDINPTTPVTVLTDMVTKVAPALADLAGCFLLLDPCELSKMIAGILKIIIGYLNCLIQSVDSLLDFQIGIDLDAAQGNPVLLASLQCAQDNADTALSNLSQAMEGIEPLLEMVGTLMELVGLPPMELPPTELSTPTAADVLAGKDPLEPVKLLRDGLQSAHDALPCK